MFEKLFIWVVITLVPLIPTFITHKFLESSAAYKNAHQGIKLGGAIAAYFILVTLAFFTYNNMFTDPFAKVRQSLAGDWSCTGTITDSDKEFDPNAAITSTMNVHINGGHTISITGHVPAMNLFWQAEEVVVSDKKLVYIFDIAITESTGITTLNFTHQDGEIKGLFGHWVITGGRGKGSLTCFRTVEKVTSTGSGFDFNKFISIFDLKTY